MPRTNLETHARSRWYNRPTILFYGNEYKDPAEIIELFSIRNKRDIVKLALGLTPVEVIN